MSTITSEQINKYYADSKDELHKTLKTVDSNITGRICHKSILLLKIVSELTDIERYMEIGVHNGGSMGLLISNPNLKYAMGIDLFEDMYDLNKHLNYNKYDTYQYFRRDDLSQKKTQSNLKKIQENFSSTAEITLVQGNSYFDETEESVKSQVGEQVDLLHIDGDHTWDGVKNDWKRYAKFVAPEGYIVLDDYHMDSIKKLVHEIIDGDEGYTLIGAFQADEQVASQYLIQKKH